MFRDPQFMYPWLSYFIFGIFYLGILVNGCPDKCICFLSTVRCTNAGLKSIPRLARTEMLRNTTVLDLRHNIIRKVERNDLVNLPNLVTLFLSNNLINYIEPGAFISQKKLKYLYLYSNNLLKVKSTSITGLFQLEQLYLQHNDIDHISPDAFLDLSKLERLYLQRNRLTSIDRGLLKPLNKLKRLRLESNRLVCDCELLLTIQEFAKSHNTHVVATCHEPVTKRGHMISALTKKDLKCGPPTLTSSHENIYPDIGETVEIPCQGEGNPKPVVFWQKNGKPLPTDGRFEIKQDGTLVIFDIQDHDTGSFECSLENILGKVSVNVIVKMKMKTIEDEELPHFTQMPGDTETIINNSARLHCRANGRPTPKIIWSREGEPLPNDPRYRQRPHGDLEIARVVTKDSGYFTCKAQNSVGSITHTANLIVKAPPVFIVTPHDQETLDSVTVSFPCRASGHPSPVINWHKDSSRLPSNGRYLVLPSGTLRILYAKKEDEGTYECQAINVVGVKVTKATLKINARELPHFTQIKGDIETIINNSTRLHCRAHGRPTPKIIWSREGEPLPNDPRYRQRPHGDLEIARVVTKDSGYFTCKAQNSVGSITHTVNLIVKGSPMSVNPTPIEANTTLELLQPHLWDGDSDDLLKAFLTKWGKEAQRDQIAEHPNLRKVKTVDEVIRAVKKAKIEKKCIRVAGSQHSTPQSIYPDHENGTTLSLTGELRKVEMQRIEESDGQKYLFVRAGAGCYLGINPMDPYSNEENSLNYQVETVGFAFPILAGISQQSVGGFMMTGSAGGSLKYGFADVIQDIEFVDGNGKLNVAKRGSDLWCAVGVSMGLIGVITHVTFRLPQTYLVKGQTVNLPFESSSLVPHGGNKGGLEENLRTHEYYHANWFPQKYVERTMEWTGKKVELGDIQPFHNELKKPLTAFAAAIVLKICNRLLQEKKQSDIAHEAIGHMLRHFVPLDEAQQFCDSWRFTLPSDDKIFSVDTIMKVDFTEIWLPLSQCKEVMKRLQKLFVDQYIAGNFATEIYGAKKSPFWMSMAYDRDVVRFDSYWWAHNKGDIREHYTYIWDQLLELPGARLHWGKWLPNPGQKCGNITFDKEFFKERYQKFDDWLTIRKKMDPDQVFVTKYWRSILEIPNA